MPRYSLIVNGRQHTLEVNGSMPLLWALRDRLGLLGTKYGCGAGACGACTVLENGAAVRSCLVTMAAVNGKRYTTIEGLSENASHPCQRAWLEEDVAQCGFCQPGMCAIAPGGASPWRPVRAGAAGAAWPRACTTRAAISRWWPKCR